MIERGYVREMGQAMHPEAVRWWFFLQDGDFSFARGGRVRKSREARHAITQAYDRAMRERPIQARQPTHRLTVAGDILPIAARGSQAMLTDPLEEEDL